jgi:hypothetical protein
MVANGKNAMRLVNPKNAVRQILETIATGALGILFWITYSAVYGPDPLPDRIPTHFGADGQPNGWGPPSLLWLLPVIAGALYLFITALALLPVRFNLPIQVTDLNRSRIEALTRQMIAFLKVYLACLFTWLQWFIIHAARQGTASFSPVIVPVFLVVVLGTIGAHIVAMIRAARIETIS